MLNRLGVALSLLIAIGLFSGACWLLFAGVQAVWQALVGLNPQLAVGVVAGATTLLATTTTVMLGRYYERKREAEEHFRADKIKIYDEFLGELFKVFGGGGEASEDMVAFLREWQRKLVLWGGSNVLSAYFKWINRLKTTADAQTIFLMDEFFRALRTDIGQNSKGLTKGAFANLILRHADFFILQAKKNPKITLAELAELEKDVFGEDG